MGLFCFVLFGWGIFFPEMRQITIVVNLFILVAWEIIVVPLVKSTFPDFFFLPSYLNLNYLLSLYIPTHTLTMFI